MARVTKQQIANQVNTLNQLLKRPQSYWSAVGKTSIGHILYDYNPIYGGYQLQEVTNESGGVSDTLLGLSWGHRYSPKEMNLFLNGVIAGLETC